MGPELQTEAGEAYTLVIIDDDDIAREAVRRALARLGITNRAEIAVDGLAAAEALESGAIVPPPLLLLDLSMPRLDGLELLERLRASEDPGLRAVPVIVITTSTRGSELARVRTLGATPIEKGRGLADRLAQAIREVTPCAS